MKMILTFFMPLLLIIVPAALYQVLMTSSRNRKIDRTHYIWVYLMLLYLWLVFSITGIGSIWDIEAKGGFILAIKQANINVIPFQSEGIFTYCMNIIMLMPLGFLLPYIWKNYRNILKVTLVGIFFSVFIEFAQIPTNRVVDIDDLMMNTLGTIIGYMLWKIIGNYFFRKSEKSRMDSIGGLEPIVYLILGCGCNYLLYNWEWFV